MDKKEAHEKPIMTRFMAFSLSFFFFLNAVFLQNLKGYIHIYTHPLVLRSCTYANHCKNENNKNKRAHLKQYTKES